MSWGNFKTLLGSALLLSVVLTAFQNCGGSGGFEVQEFSFVQISSTNLSSSIGYSSLHNQVFAAKCLICHSGANSEGNYNMSTYEGVMSGNRIVPYNANQSLLVQRLRDGSMPPGNPLNQSEIEQVAAWVDQGALENPSTPNPPTNKLPIVNAGNDRIISLPTSSVTIMASASDPDGQISKVLWTQVSGPSTAQLSGATTLNLTAANLVAGTYIFRITVTDDKGAQAMDEVNVAVNTANNQLPIVKAGNDQTLTLPATSVTLSGSASDPDGSIVSLVWSQLKGPTNAIIESPANMTTVVSNLSQGSYEFQLKATDDKGGVGMDSVLVTVNMAANKAPMVNAGNDVTITLPTNSATLRGSASDSDGAIASIQWRQVSGPSQATLSGQTTTDLSVSNLIQGSYVFEIKATDNMGATSVDTATVTVNSNQQMMNTYTWISQNILIPRCASCHGTVNPKKGYSISNYTSTMKMVIPKNSSGSKLFQMVNSGAMPQTGQPLTTSEKNAIKSWIDSGALNN